MNHVASVEENRISHSDVKKLPRRSRKNDEGNVVPTMKIMAGYKSRKRLVLQRSVIVQNAIQDSGGCNKMKCPCGVLMCYICRQVLDKRDPYKHFCRKPHCDHKKCNTCRLYTNDEEDDKLAMKEAGIVAATEFENKLREEIIMNNKNNDKKKSKDKQNGDDNDADEDDAYDDDVDVNINVNRILGEPDDDDEIPATAPVQVHRQGEDPAGRVLPQQDDERQGRRQRRRRRLRLTLENAVFFGRN